MNSLISIIIVSYNGKKWLEKCFNSLFSQTYQNFEIIFVDNGSSDDSIEFLNNNYKDERLKIVKSENNLGFASGNNLGIDNSSGEYLLLLNNDTWIENDFLEKIYNFYSDNDFDVVAPQQASYNQQEKYIFYPTLDIFGYPVLSSRKEIFYLSGVCLFLKKELYKETFGLDNNFFMYFEETDWFWRLNLLNKKFSFIDNLYIYHSGAGSTGVGLKYNLFLWRNQNCLQMLLKNYSWYNLLWILLIYFLQNIFEVIFFLIILKPKIAFSYIEGWIFNIKNLSKILEKREWVQKNRLVSDFKIMKKMYFGFGKLMALTSYLKNVKK
jgi:GT2 family glycosyltransferase